MFAGGFELDAVEEVCADHRLAAYTLWVLGLAAWRRADLDRATGLEQESLRLRKVATWQTDGENA